MGDFIGIAFGCRVIAAEIIEVTITAVFFNIHHKSEQKVQTRLSIIAF